MVNLREAEVIEKPARIDVSAIMGGVEIHVPDHWFVKTDVMPIMGGVDEQRTVIRYRDDDEDDPLRNYLKIIAHKCLERFMR